MRVIGIIVVGFLALLVLVIGGGAAFWWLGGADTHRWVARHALEAALARKVQIEGAVNIDLGAESTISVTNLSVANASWASAPNILEIGKADVQLALRPLLDGVLLMPHVELNDLTVDLETAADGRNNWQPVSTVSGSAPQQASAPAESRSIVLPLVRDLSVRDATLTYREQGSDVRTDVHLASLTARSDSTTEQIKLDGHGDINGNAFKIEGSTGSPDKALEGGSFPIDLDVERPALTTKLTGTIENLTGSQDLDLQLSARSDSLRAAAAPWGVDLPIDLQAKLDTKISGSFAAPSVVDLDAELTHAGGDRLEIKGGLANASKLTGLDASFTLALASDGQIKELLPEEWQLVQRLDASAKASGSAGDLAIEDLSAKIAAAGESTLDVTGSVKLSIVGGLALQGFELTSSASIPEPSAFDDRLDFKLSTLGPLKGIAQLSLADQKLMLDRSKVDAKAFGGFDLEADGQLGTLTPEATAILQPDLALSAKIADTAPLAALFDEAGSGFGGADLAARLTGDEQGYRLDDIKLNLGADDQLSIAATGSVGPLRAEQPDTTDLDLTLQFGWPSSQVLAPFIGQDLPELGKVDGNLELVGTIGQFTIESASIHAEQADGVVVSATGGVDQVDTAPFKIDGAAFDLDARAPSTTALARAFGHDAPDLGAVHGRTKFAENNGVISLSAIDLVSGPTDAPTIELSGAIGDVVDFEKVDLDGAFAIPTKAMIAWANLHGSAEIGTLHGKLRISDAAGQVGLEHLEAELRETHLLSLSMEGKIEDLAGIDKVKFETSLSVPNIENLAGVFDAKANGLERFQFDGTLSSSGRRFDADGKAVLGKTEFDGKIVGDLAGVRPSFTGHLTSPRVRLGDLGLKPEAESQPSPADTRRKRSITHPLFSSDAMPIERLRDLDLNVSINLQEIEGIDLAIDSATAHVTLNNGALAVSPLRFAFVGGRAEIDARINAHEAPPLWQVKAEAEDVNLGDLWAQLHTEVPIAGALDLKLDLKASGRSPRDIADSLSGDVNLAVQDGKLLTSLLGLTSLSPLYWLVTSPTRTGYSVIDCFVARLDAVKGVADVGTLVLATPDVIAKGKGTIDLRKETIDLHFKPSAKQSRLAELTTPFSITGNLTRPSVEISTAGAAARIVGEVVLSPVNLLGSLLPFVSGGKRANPCLDL